MPASQVPDRIKEALKLQDGLTSREVIEFLADIEPQQIYNALSYMVKHNQLTKTPDRRHYLPGGAAKKLSHSKVTPYQNGHSNGHASVADTVKLASYQQGRKGKQVMIISAPVYHDDVVKVELCGNTVIPIPMFGGMTICTGPDIPKLSPDQETYRHLKEIRLHFRGGKVETIVLSESSVITIAPIQVSE